MRGTSEMLLMLLSNLAQDSRKESDEMRLTVWRRLGRKKWKKVPAWLPRDGLLSGCGGSSLGRGHETLKAADGASASSHSRSASAQCGCPPAKSGFLAR